MEIRLGNQQRHSITAVLLSAVAVVFGLVLVDIVSSPEPDPLGARTEANDTTSTSADVEVSESGDITAGVARSNARFLLNPDVTVPGVGSSTTSAARRRTSAADVVTSSPATSASTTTTVTATLRPDTSGSSSTSTTLSTSTTADPPPKPSTTVDDGETTTTKKCRGNRPGCRDPKP